MSIIKKGLLVFMLIITVGCSNYSINTKKEDVELICDGLDAALDCIYEDENYKYCFPYQGNYLKINGERISFPKAIEEKKITVDKIINLSKNREECSFFKINKKTNEYEKIGEQ